MLRKILYYFSLTLFFFYCRIHTFGNKQFAEEHPDSRAVLYESKTYFKRKIMVLLNTVKGFETATEVTELFKGRYKPIL